MAGMGMPGGMPGMNMGTGGGAERKTLLQFMADGIKQQVPNATVNVTETGLEVIFPKEVILKEIFSKSGDLAQIAEVEVDNRGIVVNIRM